MLSCRPTLFTQTPTHLTAGGKWPTVKLETVNSGFIKPMVSHDAVYHSSCEKRSGSSSKMEYQHSTALKWRQRVIHLFIKLMFLSYITYDITASATQANLPRTTLIKW